MSQPSYAGVVLCGGASRRMGSDKAFVEIGGKPMVLLVAQALSDAGCGPTWCQGGDSDRLESLGLVVVPDDHPGEGPVPAIISGLQNSSGADIVVSACDLPQLDVETVRRVIAAGSNEVSVATTTHGPQLLSYWPATALARLEALFEAGQRSYRHVLSEIGANEVMVPAHVLTNINTPADLTEPG